MARAEKTARDGTKVIKPGTPLHVGVLVSHAPDAKPDDLQKLAEKLIKTTDKELEDVTGARWKFSVTIPHRLSMDGPRNVSDFYDEAAQAMVEGGFDLVVVLTDVGVAAQDRAVVYGSYSRTGRVAVMSTYRLIQGSRAEEKRTLEHKEVVTNGAALMLHLIGHLVGVKHVWRQEIGRASCRERV